MWTRIVRILVILWMNCDKYFESIKKFLRKLHNYYRNIFIKILKIIYFLIDIVLFCSYNGLQKVGNTAENCKWYNFCPDLGVTPRILFTQNRISIENSK